MCIVMQTKIREKLKSQLLVDIWNTLELAKAKETKRASELQKGNENQAEVSGNQKGMCNVECQGKQSRQLSQAGKIGQKLETDGK